MSAQASHESPVTPGFLHVLNTRVNLMNRPLIALIPLMFLKGCGESEQSALQKQFLLQSAPKSLSAISRVRKTLKKDEAPKSIEVALEGKIYAGKENEPWEPGRAAFFLTYFGGHDGESDHDPFECGYCSSTIEDYRAFVQFRDSAGNVIGIDSRELLNVKEKQNVIVKGTATLDPSGEEVLIDGTGIYIPKK